MLNIGAPELLVILVLALLVVGPRRLPELGRSLGKGLREIRKAQDEVRKTIQVNLTEEERPTFAERQRPSAAAPTHKESPAAAPLAGEARAAQGDVNAAEDESPEDKGATPAAAEPLSEVSRTLGRSLAELRRAREQIQRSLNVELDDPPGRDVRSE